MVITSNTEWRIASDEPWITISDTLGMNSKTITLTVAANALSGRQGIVHINPLGVSPVDVTITQSGLPTAINQTDQDPVRIYLAKNVLYVNGAKDCILQILTIDGRLLLSKRITNNRETLSVDALPEGIYLVKAGNTCFKMAR